MWEELVSLIYHTNCSVDCWYAYACPLYKFEMSENLHVYKENSLYGYYGKDDMEANAKGAYEFYLKPENLQVAIDIIKKAGKRNRPYVERVRATNLDEQSNEELAAILAEGYETLIDTIGAHFLSMPQAFWEFERHIKAELKEKLKEPTPEAIETAFLDLTASTKPAEVHDSNDMEALKQKQEDLLTELKLTPDTKQLLHVIRELSWLRLNKTRIWQTDCRNIEWSIFQVLGKRFPITAHQFRLCLPEEVQEILKKGEVPEHIMKEIKQREILCICHAKGKDKTYYAGEEAKEKFKELVGEKGLPENEVRGVPAHPGVITAKARVFKNEDYSVEKTNSEMQKGEVLVIQNSWPELLPACSKAAAIVTNEGGVCSHGSVVAREFGIPCVVGAIVATKVFKTGDTLEVDGTNGVVRKV